MGDVTDLHEGLGLSATAEAVRQQAMLDEAVRERRRQIAAGLRELADVIEDIEIPLSAPPTIGCWLWQQPGDENSAKLKGRLAQVAQRLGGRVDKGATDFAFELRRTFSGGVSYVVFAEREAVCQKVVVESREVTERIHDPELIRDVPMIDHTRTEEKVRWECPPLLASLRSDDLNA